MKLSHSLETDDPLSPESTIITTGIHTARHPHMLSSAPLSRLLTCAA